MSFSCYHIIIQFSPIFIVVQLHRHVLRPRQRLISNLLLDYRTNPVAPTSLGLSLMTSLRCYSPSTAAVCGPIMELMPFFPACRLPLKPNQAFLGPADNCRVDRSSSDWSPVLLFISQQMFTHHLVSFLPLWMALLFSQSIAYWSDGFGIRWRLPHWLKCCLFPLRCVPKKLRPFCRSRVLATEIIIFCFTHSISLGFFVTTQLDEIIAKYFYLFCATELILKRRFSTMHFVRCQFWHRYPSLDECTARL